MSSFNDEDSATLHEYDDRELTQLVDRLEQNLTLVSDLPRLRDYFSRPGCLLLISFDGRVPWLYRINEDRYDRRYLQCLDVDDGWSDLTEVRRDPTTGLVTFSSACFGYSDEYPIFDVLGAISHGYPIPLSVAIWRVDAPWVVSGYISKIEARGEWRKKWEDMFHGQS